MCDSSETLVKAQNHPGQLEAKGIEKDETLNAKIFDHASKATRRRYNLSRGPRRCAVGGRPAAAERAGGSLTWRGIACCARDNLPSRRVSQAPTPPHAVYDSRGKACVCGAASN